MNVWKSPILYVGIAIALIVGGLVIAPWFIDWNGYRGKLESFGESLTGRQVTIAGDISARLFPWPRLRVEGLRITNPDGAMMPELLRAQAVEAEFLLSPLFSGDFEISAIIIDKPIIGLERLEKGGASWMLTPKQGESLLPDNISFADISLRDGTVFLSDGIAGGTRELENFDAALSAPALHGPWKLRGTFTHRQTRIALSASTGRMEAGQPLLFGFRLRPETSGGYDVYF
ncbi:MAG: AsmA family protein [Aestuariivirgaceae bacterium]|nr:AsmA family protein [Aestuariivirgaceae bacterium]